MTVIQPIWTLRVPPQLQEESFYADSHALSFMLVARFPRSFIPAFEQIFHPPSAFLACGS